MAFNKVILMGNLTANPELKQTTTGVSACTFTIAVNRKPTKEGAQECDFFTIVSYRKTAEFVAKWFKKGRAILVCGELRNRNWTNKDGVKHWVTEVMAEDVTFAGNADGGGQSVKEKQTDGNNGVNDPKYNPFTAAKFEEINQDDDLPF